MKEPGNRGLSPIIASATFVRSAYGCPAGQYHKGLSCYRCPAGSEKITFLGAFNPGKSCRVLTCQDGLRVTPRPPKTLQGIGPEYTPVCGERLDLPAFIKDIARERIAKTPAFNDAVKEFLKALYQDQDLRAALRNKDWARALYMIRSMPQYQVLKQNAVQYGYASMSLGAVADVQVIGGANREAGIAVDWDDRVYTYQTSGLSLGIALGGDVGFNLGFWTVPASQLGGYAQGTTFSVSGGLAPGLGVSLGAGTWISYYPYEFLGVTWTLGGGAGAELGEYNEVVTTNLRPLTN